VPITVPITPFPSGRHLRVVGALSVTLPGTSLPGQEGRHLRSGFGPEHFKINRKATLLDVVNHYDAQFKISLSDANKKDLVEYMEGI
jgi:hypothetical protein